jgi:hypothetical protein
VDTPLDKGSDYKSRQLPKPELNPLFNPILADNLGRWAQVYYTSPPEKREEAVIELLRELEQESGGLYEGAPVGSSSHPRVPPAIACPACGARNWADQRFCGSCGVRLEEDVAALLANAAPAAHATPSPVARERGGLDRWRRDSLARHARIRPSWHRQRNYLLATSVFLLVCCGLLLNLRHRAGRKTESALTDGSGLTGQGQLPESSSPSANAGARTANRSQQPGSHAVSRPIPMPSAIATEPGRQEASGSNSQSAALGGETLSGNGAQELGLAEQYLNGQGTPRDAGQAAKWLWKAVSKQNANALVPLSDLYLRGDGVAQSCDQARLLLIAAAKKGVPSAEPKLRNLEAASCP